MREPMAGRYFLTYLIPSLIKVSLIFRADGKFFHSLIFTPLDN